MRLVLAVSLFASLCLASPADAQRPVVFARAPAPGGTLVVPLRSADGLALAGDTLDAPTRTAIARALTTGEFDFGRGSTMTLRGVGSWTKIVVVGTGAAPVDAAMVQDLGGTAAQEAGSNGPLSILAQTVPGTDAGMNLALGASLGGYTFDKYKFVDPAKPAPANNAPLTIVGASPQAAAAYAREGRALADAVRFSRDLATEPANVLYPEVFVERTRAQLAGVRGVSIEVLDVPRMRQLGMGSILSVGQGSQRPPRMMIVEYRGAAGAPTVALAGKGITFDSGGISLKPGSGMWAMKGDMAGAASVIGAAISLAKSQAPVNVVAIAALAENMPSETATRPGDVVKAYNGKTIEILNTDAEGRLVLADAVSYAERRYRPAAIVDVATLTGAVVGALGDEYAGLFSRHDQLASQLLAAGQRAGEPLWRLPLHDNYARDMRSDIADIKNVVEGGGPGAGLGAHFIGYFVESTPWAHLDIAGMDRRTSSLPTVPTGFSAFSVRLLDRFVRDFRPVPAAPVPAAAD